MSKLFFFSNKFRKRQIVLIVHHNVNMFMLLYSRVALYTHLPFAATFLRYVQLTSNSVCSCRDCRLDADVTIDLLHIAFFVAGSIRDKFQADISIKDKDLLHRRCK